MDHECDYASHPRLPEPTDGWRPPTVGEVVLYRAQCHSDTLELLMVLQVSIADMGDPNCWTVSDAGLRMPVRFKSVGGVIVPDTPNPMVSLGDTVDGVRLTTRQARFAGSPGWFRSGEG